MKNKNHFLICLILGWMALLPATTLLSAILGYELIIYKVVEVLTVVTIVIVLISGILCCTKERQISKTDVTLLVLLWPLLGVN